MADLKDNLVLRTALRRLLERREFSGFVDDNYLVEVRQHPDAVEPASVLHVCGNRVAHYYNALNKLYVRHPDLDGHHGTVMARRAASAILALLHNPETHPIGERPSDWQRIDIGPLGLAAFRASLQPPTNTTVVENADAQP